MCIYRIYLFRYRMPDYLLSYKYSVSVIASLSSGFIVFTYFCFCSDPDDNNRVKLSVLPNIPHSDYINASYVDVSISHNKSEM